MNAHSIRHAWFPPTIPKRKISLTELDTESEWPSAFRALSGPAHAPRPAKRIKALEGGLAGLKLDMGAGMNGWKTNVEPSPEEVMQEEQQEPSAAGSQIHETHFSSEAEPYISSIYEYASPYPTTTGSSVVSLPLRGEVSEASASDEERDQKEREMVGRETVVNVQAQRGLPGYVVYEPEAGTEKRKSRGEEDEMEMEERDSKAGKKKWFEPEKDRIVILDLESSEDESVTRSPRRRRSAFSLNTSTSPPSPTTSSPESPDGGEYIINPALLSHISSPIGKPVIPREEDPGKAIVLFRPVLPWGSGGGVPDSPTSEAGSRAGEEDRRVVEDDDVVEMEASPFVEDEDAMDVDS